MKKIVVCILAVSSSFAMSVSAQSMKVVADKIGGHVGDKIILRSDSMNAMADMKRQSKGQENVVLPSECQVLEGQLIRKALVLQAQKDSIHVSEEEIDAALDNQVRQFIQAYGSKDVLAEIAGKTVYQIKEDFKETFRETKLSEQMQSKILDTEKITPTTVKA